MLRVTLKGWTTSKRTTRPDLASDSRLVIALAYWMAIHAITQDAIAPLPLWDFSLYLSTYLKKSAKQGAGRNHSHFRRYDTFAVDASEVVMRVFAWVI